ncbi:MULTISPECIES: hypothetical protein [unclassified Saccharicrinis]|uniref:hypothetical protein n=1 Tax=unclassified Saccharicrinis TaxID=2646859 RepID=UPI003D33765A
MKKLDKKIDHEIDRILQSGVKRENVNTSPFFTTNVIGKVEQLEDKQVWFSRLSLVLRPVLVLLVIVNMVNYYMYNRSSIAETSNNNNMELAVNDYVAWNSDFILTDDIITDN